MAMRLPWAVRVLSVAAALVLASYGVHGLAAPASAATAAGFVGNIGTATKTTGTNSSITITVGALGVAANDSIIVAFTSSTFAGAVKCADSKFNAYLVDADRINGNAGRVSICSAHNVTPLVFGDTITATYPSFSGGTSVTANEFSGLRPNETRDKTSTGTGNSALPNSGLTATTSQSDELLYGAILFSGTNVALFTPGAGYTRTNPDLSVSGRRLASEYQNVSATGAYRANGTLSIANQWAAAIATYRVQTRLMFVSGQTTGFAPNSYTTLANNDVAYSFANSRPALNDYAIFETHNPWGSTIVKDAITAGPHTYTVFPPSALAGFPFSDYRVVVLNWDDTDVSAFGPDYILAIPALEAYVNAGNVLWIQGAIQAGGGLTYPLPFGGTATFDLQFDNFIVDTASPLVANFLVPNPFSGTFASHTSFGLLPGDAHVIIVGGLIAGGATTLYELRR